MAQQHPTATTAAAATAEDGYAREQMPADVARRLLAQCGVALPANVRGNLALHSFALTRQQRVVFCRHFFAVVQAPQTIVRAELLSDDAADADAAAPSQKQPKQPKGPAQFLLSRRGFVLQSLAQSTVLDEPLMNQLAMSSATQKHVAATDAAATAATGDPTAARSDCALSVLRQLRRYFKPISPPPVDADVPSHRWVGGKDCISAMTLIELTYEVTAIFEQEASLLSVEPPVYVIGDLHGNYRDLMCFADAFGMLRSADFVPARFLFLGDYVDRGPHSVETIAYVLAMKCLYPSKIFLLRGNHEAAIVNGDIQGYGSGSLRAQCAVAYGPQGQDVWAALNQAMDVMPIAARIESIFCVHGGVPRLLSTSPHCDILGTIKAIQRPIIPGDESYDLAFDLMWADPATTEQEEQGQLGTGGFPPGFGQSMRGPEACVFGREAVREFFRRTGMTRIIRAHQYSSLGFELKKDASVLTVFSSSGYDWNNRAAAILVNERSLQVIMVNSAAPDEGDLMTSTDATQQFIPSPPPPITSHVWAPPSDPPPPYQ